MGQGRCEKLNRRKAAGHAAPRPSLSMCCWTRLACTCSADLAALKEVQALAKVRAGGLGWAKPRVFSFLFRCPELILQRPFCGSNHMPQARRVQHRLYVSSTERGGDPGWDPGAPLTGQEAFAPGAALPRLVAKGLAASAALRLLHLAAVDARAMPMPVLVGWWGRGVGESMNLGWSP